MICTSRTAVSGELSKITDSLVTAQDQEGAQYPSTCLQVPVSYFHSSPYGRSQPLWKVAAPKAGQAGTPKLAMETACQTREGWQFIGVVFEFSRRIYVYEGVILVKKDGSIRESRIGLAEAALVKKG